MSNLTRKIETQLRTELHSEITGLDEIKVSGIIATILHRQGQVWQNES